MAPAAAQSPAGAARTASAAPEASTATDEAAAVPPRDLSRQLVRARRLRLAGISLLSLYGVAIFGGGAIGEATDTDCGDQDQLICFDFPYAVHAMVAALLSTPLLAAGAVTLSMGKRRQRNLLRHHPELSVSGRGLRVGWTLRF